MTNDLEFFPVQMLFIIVLKKIIIIRKPYSYMGSKEMYTLDRKSAGRKRKYELSFFGSRLIHGL